MSESKMERGKIMVDVRTTSKHHRQNKEHLGGCDILQEKLKH